MFKNTKKHTRIDYKHSAKGDAKRLQTYHALICLEKTFHFIKVKDYEAFIYDGKPTRKIPLFDFKKLTSKVCHYQSCCLTQMSFKKSFYHKRWEKTVRSYQCSDEKCLKSLLILGKP